MTGCAVADVFDLVDQHPRTSRSDTGRYWRTAVEGRTFGYVWEPTGTVGHQQTLAELAFEAADRTRRADRTPRRQAAPLGCPCLRSAESPPGKGQ
jgi:hypothetical protein